MAGADPVFHLQDGVERKITTKTSMKEINNTY